MYHSAVQDATAEAYIAADGARIIDIVGVFAEPDSRGVREEAENPNQSSHMRPTDGGAFFLPSETGSPFLRYATISAVIRERDANRDVNGWALHMEGRAFGSMA